MIDEQSQRVTRLRIRPLSHRGWPILEENIVHIVDIGSLATDMTKQEHKPAKNV